MPKRYRLRPLQVCVSRHNGGGVLSGECEQDTQQLFDKPLDFLALLPQVEPHVKRNLVIAAPAGVQLLPDRP